MCENQGYLVSRLPKQDFDEMPKKHTCHCGDYAELKAQHFVLQQEIAEVRKAVADMITSLPDDVCLTAGIAAYANKYLYNYIG
jgi:hypothetical protein